MVYLWSTTESRGAASTAPGMPTKELASMGHKSTPLRPIEKFWQLTVKVDEPDGCWLWTGARNSNGYGCFVPERGASQVRAHRWLYERLVGPIPPRAHMHHVCKVKHCVNPVHLQALTPAEHVALHPHPNGFKTHCPQGHPYDGQNTRITTDGRRLCRTCQREHSRKRKARLRMEAGKPEPRPKARPDSTHCTHGHPFDAENTYISDKGHRRCRTCQRESLRRFKARQKGTPSA